MPSTSYWSVAELLAMPADGIRYETVHGELLVTPSPALFHQLLAARLMSQLSRYLDAHEIEGLLTSPADITWGRDDTLVQPDLFVADVEGLLPAGKWSDLRNLHLAVEILSPFTTRADRFTKRRVYQEQGVATYWVVDGDNAQVEIWTPEAHFPVVERDTLRWQHPSLDQPVVISLPALFKRT